MINSSVSVDQISKGVGLTVFIPFADGVYMPVIKNCENFNNNGLQKYNELESTMGKIEAIYNVSFYFLKILGKFEERS